MRARRLCITFASFCLPLTLVAAGCGSGGDAGDDDFVPSAGGTSAGSGSTPAGSGGTPAAGSGGSAHSVGGSGGMSGAGTAGTGGVGGAGNAGEAGAAGLAGMAGMAGTAGSAGSGDAMMCPYTGPPIFDPTSFPDCTPACPGAHCVPAALAPASAASQLAMCGDDSAGLCVPDFLISSLGNAVPPTCKSVAGAEGRCLSTCLPAIAAEQTVLPQATCADDERCAPCFNPTASDPTAPTGVCSLACDKPVDPPTVLMCPYTGPDVIDPASFPACSPACAGAHCLPGDLVPKDFQSQLTPCEGGFCAPDSIIRTAAEGVPASCEPFPGTGAEGRCLSTCLPAVAGEASELAQQGCGDNELCVPCSDPFTGKDEGSCAIACDMPKEPPFTFPGCCKSGDSDQGTCVPKGLVSSSQQGDLKQDDCPGGDADYLCVPEEYLPGSTTPIQTCSYIGFDGACVSKCVNLPGISFVLQQQGCADNHVCVPCLLASGTPGC